MRWTWPWLIAALSCTPEPVEPTAPTMRIVGSDTMTSSLLPHLVGVYGTQKGLRFQIEGGGSSDGFRALLNGKADLAASARLPTPAEIEQATAYGWAFERHLVGLSVVTLSVHPSNPLQSLTWDQARDIFCTAEIRDWSHFGMEPAPIRVLVRNERSGAREVIEDFFCGVEGISRRHETMDAVKIADEVERDPNVLTFAPLSDRKGKVLSLRQRSDSRAYAPTQANAIRFKYPLTHDLALFTAGEPSPEIDKFLRWIASPAGQHEVDEAWVVPLFLRAGLFDDPRPVRETLTFAKDSTALDERSQARLKVLSEELRNRSGEVNHIVLEAHAEPEERDPFPLSYQRAIAIRDLIARESTALFFEIIPRGDEQELAPTDTPLGRERNRSVRIFFGDDDDASRTIVTAPPSAEAE